MEDQKEKVNVFWFRRDLRLADNKALNHALAGEYPVLPVFIFDTQITEELPKDDPRITFIYDSLTKINEQLLKASSSLKSYKGDPIKTWKQLLKEFDIHAVYANEDYEPYGIQRDLEVKELLAKEDKEFHLFKDHVIFAKDEVLKKDNTPYTVYTPYKNKWRSLFGAEQRKDYRVDLWDKYLKASFDFVSLSALGFERSKIKVLPYLLEGHALYKEERDFPILDSTSKLGPHLRFGTISIREVVRQLHTNETFLNELVWREFFIQILYHFPKVVDHNFKQKYDGVQWRNDQDEFEAWKQGKTGYPIVDAGMRELNATGNMHNRVRMIVAGFLCKHLLIDWRWGESYFAKKLLDFELASNNGNWQWSAGTGCDSAPYFRIFNPTEQIKRFDNKLQYVRKWVPEFEGFEYMSPIVDHKMARERAIATYKEGIN